MKKQLFVVAAALLLTGCATRKVKLEPFNRGYRDGDAAFQRVAEGKASDYRHGYVQAVIDRWRMSQ